MAERKIYTEEFKKQIVALHGSGRSISELQVNYGVSRTAINNWIKYYRNTGSFKAKDNRTPEENKLIELEKENKRLRMENDLLNTFCQFIPHPL